LFPGFPCITDSFLTLSLDDSEARFEAINTEFEAARETAKEARETFADIRKQRCDLFNKAYSHISDKINDVYKDLTKGKSAPMGGVAYLTLEDSEVGFHRFVGATSHYIDDVRMLNRNPIFMESNIMRCHR
jgi:hypothetical protein